ncbi:GNAT family N-acetyltransferase (plasmid) [Streptomyces sp. SDT5-1]|uniref:GNAT family N-acetyltransferase n=1 Tax=Streptomyces sp. SDT5-1 TaxID=3406418 RepID=UPI003FD0CA2C
MTTLRTPPAHQSVAHHTGVSMAVPLVPPRLRSRTASRPRATPPTPPLGRSIHRIDLRDGAVTVTRRAHLGDLDRVQALHTHCSAHSRRRRYHVDRTTLSAAQWTALVNRPHSITLITTELGRPDAAIAVSHVLHLPAEPTVCEFAVLIADAWQNRGLGTALAELRAAWARAAGYATAYAHINRSNTPAHAIFERLGPTARTDEECVHEQLGVPGADTGGDYLDLRISLHDRRTRGARHAIAC